MTFDRRTWKGRDNKRLGKLLCTLVDFLPYSDVRIRELGQRTCKFLSCKRVTKFHVSCQRRFEENWSCMRGVGTRNSLLRTIALHSIFLPFTLHSTFLYLQLTVLLQVLSKCSPETFMRSSCMSVRPSVCPFSR